MRVALQKMHSAVTWEGRPAFLGGEGNREAFAEKEAFKPRPKC